MRSTITYLLLIYLLPYLLHEFFSDNQGILLSYVIGVSAVICFYMSGQKLGAIVFWMATTVSQPFFSMPIAVVMPEHISIFVATKDLNAVFLLTFMVMQNGIPKIVREEFGLLVFAAVYSASFFLSSAAPFAKLVSYREGIIICVLYFLGRSIPLTRTGFRRLVRNIIIISIPIALFGIFEYLVFTEEMWLAWGAIDYDFAKVFSDSVHSRLYALPTTWQTFIGDSIVRRAVSTFANPTSFGRYLVLPAMILLVMIFTAKRKNWLHSVRIPLPYFALTIITFAIALSLSRGAILSFFVAMVLYFSLINKKLLVVLSPILILMLGFELFDTGSANFQRHVSHLPDALLSMFKGNIFGEGVGNAGQAANNFGITSGHGEESYVASLINQIGAIGFVAYMLMIYSMCVTTLLSVKKQKLFSVDASIVLAMVCSAVGAFVTSLFANSAVAILSAGHIFLLCGLAKSYCIQTSHLRR